MNHKVVNFRKFESGSMLGFVDLYLYDGAINIRGCKVMNGQNGMWIAMPAHKSEKDGKYYADVNIYTSNGEKQNPAADVLMEEILKQVRIAMNGATNSTPKTTTQSATQNQAIPF